MSSSSLILENIEDNDLIPLMPAVAETECRICLDFGHLIAYGQWRLLDEVSVHNRLCMLHVYAPVGGHSHKGLTDLSIRDHHTLKSLLPMLPATGVVVLEVFSWPDLKSSLDIFSLWIRNWDSTS